MKRILQQFVATFTLLFFTCKSDEDKLVTLNSHIDLTGSSIEDDQAHTEMLFSTDGGTTWQSFGTLKAGTKYKVKLNDTNLGLLTSDVYAFDWSESSPKPSDATSDTPEFTMATDNKVFVKVSDKHCPFDPSSWTGDWGGDEVGACCGGTDANTITQDSVDPNKFIMDNFWGDHVDAYIIFTPSTTPYDQVVELPEQITSENGTASGIGTYDQCQGTFSINTSYTIGGSTYEWVYNFHR